MTEAERRALKLANEHGWLVVTREIGENALACWQHDCTRLGRAFAVVRQEPTRVSLWCVLTSGREWTSDEQARLRAVLAGATCFILTDNQIRAYTTSEMQATLMRQVLAVDALGH